jgi:hypothetical protein
MNSAYNFNPYRRETAHKIPFQVPVNALYLQVLIIKMVPKIAG